MVNLCNQMLIWEMDKSLRQNSTQSSCQNHRCNCLLLAIRQLKVVLTVLNRQRVSSRTICRKNNSWIRQLRRQHFVGLTIQSLLHRSFPSEVSRRSHTTKMLLLMYNQVIYHLKIRHHMPQTKRLKEFMQLIIWTCLSNSRPTCKL